MKQLHFRPFVFWTAAFLLGVMIQTVSAVEISVIAMGIIAAILFCAVLWMKSARLIWMPIISFFILGMIVSFDRADVDEKSTKEVPEWLEIHEIDYKNGKTYLYGQTFDGNDEIGALVVHNQIIHCHPGQVLSVPNKWNRPGTARYPGGYDYRQYLANRDIYFIQYTDAGDLSIMQNARLSMGVVLHQWTQRLISTINRLYSTDAAGLVAGILLGDKSGMDADDRILYSQSGIGHVFAVSGFHVGMMYLLCWPLLFFRSQNKYFRVIAPMGVLVVVWLFIAVSGFASSAIRAGIMISLYEIGKMMYRPIDKWNILAWSVLPAVLWNPKVLSEIGFQFSYLALISIFLFFKNINDLYQGSNFLLKGTWTLLSLSFAAQVLLLPLSIFYFGGFSPYFWLSSLLAVVVVYFNFIFSLLTVVLGVFDLNLNFIVDIVEGLFYLMTNGIECIMKLPASYIEFRIEWMDLIYLYIIVCIVIVTCLVKEVSRFKLKMMVSTFVLIMCVEAILASRINISQQIIYQKNNSIYLHTDLNTQNWDEILRPGSVIQLIDGRTLAYLDASKTLLEHADIYILDNVHDVDRVKDIQPDMILTGSQFDYTCAKMLDKSLERSQIPYQILQFKTFNVSLK